MSKYILDTNILITAYRLTYPMDVIPTFWNKLLEKAKDNTFSLIDFVVDEIRVGEDTLRKWIDENIDDIEVLKSDDFNVIESFRVLMNDVENTEQYTQKAKEDYAASADSWILAHAHAYDYIIVTEEAYKREVKKRVIIPNVCRKFNINYLTTIEFFRQIGIKI